MFGTVNTLRPRQDGCHFCRQHVQMHFLEWKYLNYDENFIEVCSQGSNWQYASIGSDNGSAPNRRQAIIWTNDDLGYRCINASLGLTELTLNVRAPSYLGLTRSISWLLMPWLLTSPGHQQPWYWLCRIGRFLSYLRKDFNYLRHINMEKWHKMWIYVYVPSEKFST